MEPDWAAPNAGDEAIAPADRHFLLPSLSTRAQLHEVERIGAHAARLWSMRPAVLRRSDLLTETFVRELHRRMFAAIWRGAGRFRTAGNGIGWEPHRIGEGVRLFLDDADGWIRYATYPVQECAVRLHHRLVAVRPWAHGNRPHARLLADILVAASGEPPLTWGSGLESADPGSAGARYSEAVRAADAGALEPLIAFARS
ncbi:MAG TPA: mobile mystery protein B [Opitutaceae bacterium]